MKPSHLIAGSRLPVLIEPEEGNCDLSEFTRLNRDKIEAELLEAGAILFRGFSVANAGDFDKFVRVVSSRQMEYEYGSTPRTQVKDKVYTTTEYPANLEIPLHSELSYHSVWPTKVAFCCITPAEERGETPLADLRKVNQSLGADLIEEFTKRQVRYVRHYHPNIDVPWQQVFRTDDKSAVARFCAENGIRVEWLDSGILRTAQTCQGTARHSRLNELFMFNQAHLFHVSSLDASKARILIELFGKDRLPRNSYFGDGADIPPKTLEAVRNAYSTNAVEFGWQRGDVLLIDNEQVAHGRRTFKGRREILAALMDPISRAESAKPWWKPW